MRIYLLFYRLRTCTIIEKVKSLSRKMPILARKANNQIETNQSGSNTKPTKKGTAKIT